LHLVSHDLLIGLNRVTGREKLGRLRIHSFSKGALVKLRLFFLSKL
jgi:hypothetical protein